VDDLTPLAHMEPSIGDTEKSIKDVLYSLRTFQTQRKRTPVKKKKAITVIYEKDVALAKEHRPILSSSEM